MNITYPQEYLVIHLLLHNPSADRVVIYDQDVPIRKHKQGYRFVQFYTPENDLVTIAQQNLMKASVYADRARKGERISWIMPRGKGWTRIDKHVEKEFPDIFP